MNEIQQQVKRARTRLVLQQFVIVLSWALFVGLIVSIVAILIPKLIAVSFLQDASNASSWTWSWIGGTAGCALLFSIIYCWLRSASALTAAAEVDRRFGLKERVSSAISLDENSRASEFGVALIEDANKSAKKIDIGDEFSVQPGWRPLLPFGACLAVVVVMLFQNALVEPVEVTEEKEELQKRIQVAVETAKKKLEKQINKVSVKGLEETKKTLENIEREIDQFQKANVDSKKDALAKINDLKKQVQEKREKLGDPDSVRKMLAKLNPEKQGPAKKLADSLKKGNINEARDAIKKIAEEMKKNGLSAEDKEKLQQQLDKMADDLKKAVADQQKKIDDLQKQLQQAKQQGNKDAAQKLQEQLQREQSSQKQMSQMNKLADGMKSCAECLRNSGGDLSQEDIEGMMADATKALEEMDMDLEDVQKMLAQSDALKECEGSLGQCQGMMNGQKMANNGKGQGNGDGLGEGQGFGDRPISENETSNYLSRVRANPKKGEKVISGIAEGENSPGVSRIEAREQIKASMSEKVDPTETQRMARDQREHVKEYFEKLRKGK